MRKNKYIIALVLIGIFVTSNVVYANETDITAVVEPTIIEQIEEQSELTQVPTPKPTTTPKKKEKAKRIEKPKLNSAKVSMRRGEKFTIKVKNTSAKINYKVDKKDIVNAKKTTPTAVKVTAKQPGIAKVTIEIKDIKLSCKCIVRKPVTEAEKVYDTYQTQIDRASKLFGIDPYLITAIICTESSGNPLDMNSESSATGLMQVISSFYTKEDGNSGKRELNTIRGQEEITLTDIKKREDLLDINKNIMLGSCILREKTLYSKLKNLSGKTRDNKDISGFNLFIGLAYYGPTAGEMNEDFWNGYIGSKDSSHSIQKYYYQIADKDAYPWIIDDTSREIIKRYYDFNGRALN